MTPKRDENGRFVKGSSGNPNGRPAKKREERFMEITLSAVTFQDWADIIKKAVQQVKQLAPSFGDETFRLRVAKAMADEQETLAKRFGAAAMA